MQWIRCASWFLACLLAGTALFVIGCGEKDSGGVAPNVPPETVLSFAPGNGDTVVYRVRMNWFGWDPDGEVTHFLARWDSLDWFSTVKTESVFILETEERPDSTHSYRRHSFDVKAVDNEGSEDPTPASVIFTASNSHPDTEIVSGPSGIIGAFAEFEWTGTDSDGEVAGYGYRLSRRDGYDWIVIASEDSLGAEETVALFGPLEHGHHRFEVWAIDDRGAADPSPAEDEFSVAVCCPLLEIRVNHLGADTFVGTDWDSWPHGDPIEVLAGEHFVFDWYALPDIIGYRHAYDDTSEWPEWSIDATHFEVTAEPGLHTLYVYAKDLLGRAARGRVRLDVVAADLDNYILIVDDYDLWETYPEWGWGSDADRSQFYDLMVAPFGARAEWEPSEHSDVEGPRPPDPSALSGASTVVWYGDGDRTTLARLFEEPYGSFRYNPLAGYMRIGGNLVLCGFETTREITSGHYPIETTPGDTSRPDAFVRDVLRVGWAESSGQSANKNIPWEYGYCFYGAEPTDPGLFEAMYIDSLGKWWPLYGSDHPNYRRGGLAMVEKLEAYQGSALPILEIDSYLNTEFAGETCGLLHLSGSDRGNVCYLGFPLYYLKTEEVQAFFAELLPLFGEERR